MARLKKEEKLLAYKDAKSHIAIENMTYRNDPPQFISITGPSNSGKKEIFNEILNKFTGKDIEWNGIVTLKIKKKRMMFYKSNNDIYNNIDVVKVSDVIVHMINLNVGIENDTLEFISMIKHTGLSKIMFVFTHIGKKYDERKRFGSNESLIKKTIEKRISKEFSFDVKFFDLKKEKIETLTRYIELTKSRPIEWKTKHSHIVFDKMVDGVLYGYLRGGPVASGRNIVYIPGVGDTKINISIEDIDPCSMESKKKVVVYSPEEIMDSESIKSTKISDRRKDFFKLEGEDIKIFSDIELNNNKNDIMKESESTENNKEVDEIYIESVTSDVGNSDGSKNIDDDMEKCFCGLEERIYKKLKDEEEFVSNFYENCSEEETSENGEKEIITRKSIVDKDKKKEEERVSLMKKVKNVIYPGSYCQIELEDKISWDKKNILLAGFSLSTEGGDSIMRGKVTKNKLVEKDLKTNSPYFVSLGWKRFQTIPLFSIENRMVKYLKKYVGVSLTDVVFYGPTVGENTSFFIFDPSEKYRILAGGNIISSNYTDPIKKKLKIIGYPKSINGNSVIVGSMFKSKMEAERFTRAKLQTVSGLRGIIKNSDGKNGDIRATFEGNILMSDIIFIKTYVTINPYRYKKDIIPGEEYIRPIREVKKELGMPLYEESLESESGETETIRSISCDEKSEKSKKLKHEIRKLEKNLPHTLRKDTLIIEKISIPKSPEEILYEKYVKEIEDKRKNIEEIKKKETEEKEKRQSMKKENEEKEKEERKRLNAIRSKKYKESRMKKFLR